ncbi:5-(carboxyamino)imidazole ribonucleotide mutase [candidate division KSB1 bacterium]
MAKVAIMVGSESDREVMSDAIKYLDYFGIESDFKVLSAHRNAEECARYAGDAVKNGFSAIIAGAGMAAALPGVVAAHTDLPVIGVPLDASPLNGVDALYSIVQMPPGVPVGCVAIGKAGARNAAVLAARIIGLSDPEIQTKLIEFRKNGFKL